MSQQDREVLQMRLEAADALIQGFQHLLSELELERPTDQREKEMQFMRCATIETSLNWLRDEREALRNTIDYYGGPI